MTRTTRIALGLAALALIAAACTGGGDDESATGRAPEALEPAPAGGRGAVADVGRGPAGFAVGGDTLPGIGPAVIKTAEVDLEVARGRVDDAIRQATAAVAGHGGHVVATTIEGKRATTGSLVLRVPAERFEQALADVEELGDVESKTVSGEDVSQEFVDLEARLRNLKAQEAVLLRLMDDARTVRDTIRVQQRLQQVQLEIERIRGRLSFLEDQATLSTITVNFAAAGAVADKPGTFEKAWDQAVDVATGIASGLIVATGFIVPIGLLLGLIYVALRRLLPKVT